MKFWSVVLLVLLISFPLWGQRIISLAPALTEIVAEIGLGDHLIGRTKYCDYPPAVQQVPVVGGLLDLNLEFIYRLQPDWIICYQEQVDQVKVALKTGRVIGFKHQTLSDLKTTIISIGKQFRVEERANKIVSEIQEKLTRVRQKAAKLPAKKVLFVVSREGAVFKNIIVAGNGDFLSELLGIAGAKNAYQGKIAYPSLSLEAIITLKPDLLIEFCYQQKYDRSPEKIVAEWQQQFLQLGGHKPEVKVVADLVLLRLGPRIGIAGEELLRIIHGK